MHRINQSFLFLFFKKEILPYCRGATTMNRTRILLALGAIIVVAALVFTWEERARLAPPVAPVITHKVAPAPVAQPADCRLPGPPPVAPDGATASIADMKLGQTAIQNFVLQLEAYQACRDSQADHAAPGTAQAQKDDWIKQGDDAVDEAHALADAFSAQLKIFKARGGGQ
jgi:hypothetical protein